MSGSKPSAGPKTWTRTDHTLGYMYEIKHPMNYYAASFSSASNPTRAASVTNISRLNSSPLLFSSFDTPWLRDSMRFAASACVHP